jgi:hypothetical protein
MPVAKRSSGKRKDRGLEKPAGDRNMKSTDFVVARHDLQQCKFIERSCRTPPHCPTRRCWSKSTRFAFTAGNSELRAKLHRHFGDRMKYSGASGSRTAVIADEPQLPGAKPAWFFAPDQIRKRAKEWGPGASTPDSARRGGFCSDAGSMAQGHGRPRRGPVKQVYLDTLTGVFRRITGTSCRWRHSGVLLAPFLRDLDRYRLRFWENAAKTAGQGNANVGQNRRYLDRRGKLAGAIRNGARRTR